MLLRAVHNTTYRYRTPASDSHNEVRLMPLSDEFQTLEGFNLIVSPQTAIHAYQEPGGTVNYFGCSEFHNLLSITAEAMVDTHLADPFVGLNVLEPDWKFFELDSTKGDHAEFLAPSRFVELSAEVHELAHSLRKKFQPESGPVAQFLIDIGHEIHERLDYMPGITDIHTTVHEVLELGAGVCQDFAHLMIACCRAIGIPARYVSGYLFVGDDATMRGNQATHAWVECPMPDGRWLSIDPTNDLLANDHYIRIHTGRDYSDVPPTRGVYMGTSAESLDVSVRVERVEADVWA